MLPTYYNTYSVAITGGIGSGKSTISKLFGDLDVPVIDADIISKEIMQPSHSIFKKVIKTFGSHILTKTGSLDRNKLKNIIFNDKDKRSKLESILHPAIYSEIDKRLINITQAYSIVVVPLLIDNMKMNDFDRVLLVTIPEDLQIERIIKRDRISVQQAKKIIASQEKNKTRIKYADDIIDDTVKLDELLIIINSLHRKYLTFAKIKQKQI